MKHIGDIVVVTCERPSGTEKIHTKGDVGIIAMRYPSKEEKDGFYYEVWTHPNEKEGFYYSGDELRHANTLEILMYLRKLFHVKGE